MSRRREQEGQATVILVISLLVLLGIPPMRGAPADAPPCPADAGEEQYDDDGNRSERQEPGPADDCQADEGNHQHRREHQPPLGGKAR